ncbi:MAG: hypothetical protein RL619_1949 [Bacteroidota bacterium]|jgi:hypothetical protein
MTTSKTKWLNPFQNLFQQWNKNNTYKKRLSVEKAFFIKQKSIL